MRKATCTAFFFFILCLGLALPARAFTFYLFSNYESTFKDFDNTTEQLPTTPKNWDTLDHLSIEAAELPGYRFLGWYTNKNGWGETEPTVDSVDATPFVTTLKITGEQIRTAGTWSSSKYPTIVAKYLPYYEILAVVSPTGTGTASGSGTFDEGKKVTLSSTANSGYALKGWQKGGQLVSPTNFSFIAAEGCAGTYTAVFTGKVYKVNLGGGGEGGESSVLAQYGSSLPALKDLPEKYGYDFDGYFGESDGKGTRYYNKDGTSAHVWDQAANATVFANWIPQMGDLHLTLNEGVAALCYRTGEKNNWQTNWVSTTVQLQVGTRVHAYGIPEDGYEIVDYHIENQWDREILKDGLTFRPTARKLPTIYKVVFVDPTGANAPVTNSVPENGSATAPEWTRTAYMLSWDREFSKVTAPLTVTAVWTPIQYLIRFDANGGDGTMDDQSVSYDEEVALSANRFTNESLFFSHWTTSVDKVEYPDGAIVSNLTTVAGATNFFYAVWEKHFYTVRFFGNGGTNTMDVQDFEYGVPQALAANRFIRDGFDFAGWATDPTNETAYADEEEVSNLTAVAGGTVCLYAKWTKEGAPELSDLSQAIGCVSANLMTNQPGWTVVRGIGKDGGTALRTNVEAYDYRSYLEVVLKGKGRLTFRCKTQIEPNPVMEDPWYPESVAGDPSRFCFTREDVMPNRMDSVDWSEYVYEKESVNDETVQWWIVMHNKNHSAEEDYGCGSDDDYALIDLVRWEPAVTNALTVGVTFRDANGGVFTNVTRKAGETIGALPVLKNIEEKDCVWTYDGKAIDSNWKVPAAADGVELLPSWTLEPSPEHPVPETKDAVTISSAAVSGDTFTLSFTSDAQFDYNLLTNANLQIDSWGVMETLVGDGTTLTFEPQIIEGQPQLFYKVETIQKKSY